MLRLTSLRTWICLYVHWNIDAGTNGSYVYCNSKKRASFTSYSSAGNTQLTFADINPNGKAQLDGDISLFFEGLNLYSYVR